MTPLVLALAGTDHHPFDRMVAWVDAAAAARPAVRFVVQHGASRPPEVAEGHEFLTHARMVELLAVACGVVCHGGPGTIMDARAAGHVPICVPRDPRRGEHVDGHQERFVALVGAAGMVHAITTAQELVDAVDQLLRAGPAACRAPVDVDPVTVRARARLVAELDGLLRPPTGPDALLPTAATTRLPRGRRRVASTRGGPR